MLRSALIWEGKKRMQGEWRVLQPGEQGWTQPEQVAGITSTADANRQMSEPPTSCEPRESIGTCSAEPDSRGSVLSCKLRIWAHNEKYWVLAGQDSKQFRKQGTAELWTLILFSYMPTTHLLQCIWILLHSPCPRLLQCFHFCCCCFPVFPFLKEKVLMTADCSQFLAAASCSVSFSLCCSVKK